MDRQFLPALAMLFFFCRYSKNLFLSRGGCHRRLSLAAYFLCFSSCRVPSFLCVFPLEFALFFITSTQPRPAHTAFFPSKKKTEQLFRARIWLITGKVFVHVLSPGPLHPSLSPRLLSQHYPSRALWLSARSVISGVLRVVHGRAVLAGLRDALQVRWGVG